MPALHKSKQDAVDHTGIGEWTFFGQNQPEISDKRSQTFSVGVFRIAVNPQTGKKDAQNSVMRITGLSDNPEFVYRWAQYCVDALNDLRKPSPFVLNSKIEALKKRVAEEKLKT